jgi:hypothetical protein
MGFGIPEWAIGVGVIIIAVQLGKVVSAMLGRGGGGGGGWHRVLNAPSDRDAGELREALDAMQQRVTELEERVDFAERLLAKQREADRKLPSAGD